MILYPSSRVTLWVNFISESTNFYILDTLPSYVKVELNSYQQADEFEIKVDYNIFPIDPRKIKSCGIGIWIGSTTNIDELIPKTEEDALLTGFVDDYEIVMEKESQVLNMKGRDFTGILLDKKWFYGNVPLSLELDEACQYVLNHNDDFKNIKVVNKTGETLPLLSKAKLRSYEEHTPNKEDSYWDIIYDLCLQAGFICYIKCDELIIDKAKNLYQDTIPTKFIYGQNLESLNFKKQFGKHTGLNIEVRSYDPTIKQTIKAVYPNPMIEQDKMVIPTKNMNLKTEVVHTKPPKKKSSKPGNVQGPSQHYEITTFNVSNIRDKNRLEEIAENIWNQLHRKQMEGSLKTFDMFALDEKSSLLKLRNGDPIQITVDDKFTQMIVNLPEKELIDYLQSKTTLNPQVLNEMVKNIDQIDQMFYVQKIRFEMEKNDGFSIDMDFVNYIRVE